MDELIHFTDPTKEVGRKIKEKSEILTDFLKSLSLVLFVLVVSIIQPLGRPLLILGQQSQQNVSTNETLQLTKNRDMTRDTTTSSDSVIPNFDWIMLLLQILDGGLLAGLIIFVANVALDKHRRP